jgi:hypothetical protein
VVDCDMADLPVCVMVKSSTHVALAFTG